MQVSLQKANSRLCYDFLILDFYCKNSSHVTWKTMGEHFSFFLALVYSCHYSDKVSIYTFCITQESTSDMSSWRIYSLIICLDYLILQITVTSLSLFNHFGKCLDLKPAYPFLLKKKNYIYIGIKTLSNLWNILYLAVKCPLVLLNICLINIAFQNSSCLTFWLDLKKETKKELVLIHLLLEQWLHHHSFLLCWQARPHCHLPRLKEA